MQLCGVRPYFSDKFHITKHPKYKYPSDADPKNGALRKPPPVQSTLSDIFSAFYPVQKLKSAIRNPASSQDQPAQNAVDENIRTWWKAAAGDKTPWLQVDLGDSCSVHAVQINCADDMGLAPQLPQGARLVGEAGRGRYIEERSFCTGWLLEASADGKSWFILEDKRNAGTDLPHDLVVKPEGISARYIRLTVTDTPYGAPACVSGLRVFGRGQGNAPGQAVKVKALRTDGMTMQVNWQGDAVGYEVLWGHRPDKLYHSYRVFASTELEIRALMADVEHYYVRVDAFNKNGITVGEVVSVEW